MKNRNKIKLLKEGANWIQGRELYELSPTYL